MVRQTFFPNSDNRPQGFSSATRDGSTVVIKTLVRPEYLVQIEAIAVVA